MDLNHIKLPASIIADLYQSVLIETDETALIQPETLIPEEQTIPDAIKQNEMAWLGENRKNILIAVKYSNAVHIPDDELTFLTGILAACKLNIGDIALLNLHNYPMLSYKELLTHFKSNIIFLFGIEPITLGLPINFPHFQSQPFSNCSFLFSPVLKDLENDRVLKSKLWVCLRKKFNV